MNRKHLQIDISNSKYQPEHDLIQIKFQNEDFIQVNFSKLFIESKYIQDKYKYTEAISSIQTEIDIIAKKFNIKDESIKNFLQLIQDEKISIPIELYRDIYTLSQHFCVHKLIYELDNISQNELFNNLDFTIQILVDSITAKNNLETKLSCKIEEFLAERINECFENDNFKKLPMSTICRILDKSKGKFDHNLLIDFICDSVESRFILFKFVELHKMREEKVDEFIKFIDEQEENSKQIYLEYWPFNHLYIKNVKNKYDQLFKEMNQNKQELEQMKLKIEQTKQELEQANMKCEKAEQEINQSKQELEQANI